MIQALILDIDGVIVGETPGKNFPLPNDKVANYLKDIQNKGIPIALCTGKANFGIEATVDKLDLDNLHITNGGATLMDGKTKEVVKAHALPKDTVIDIVKNYKDNIFVELYTVDKWYVQKGINEKLQKQHTAVLQQEAVVADDLLKVAEENEIVKIMIMVNDWDEKDIFIPKFADYEKSVKLSWTNHPSMLPTQFALFTAQGISKKTGGIEIAEFLNIPLENILGVGDNDVDWQFMEMCGYAASMGNGTEGIKNLVKTKGDKGFVGGSVEDDGIISIIEHFKSEFNFKSYYAEAL